MAQYDAGTEQKLKDIQKTLSDNGFVGKQTPNLKNHITLGTYNIAQEDWLIDRIHIVTEQSFSFDIRLNNIGLFGLSVLFIAPAVNHELLNLQSKFNSNYADGFEWTAHTTLLIDEPKTIYRALPQVADAFQPFYGKIESISLYEFWPTRFICEKWLQI